MTESEGKINLFHSKKMLESNLLAQGTHDYYRKKNSVYTFDSFMVEY